MAAISYWSKDESCELATVRGAFPAFPESVYAEGRLAHEVEPLESLAGTALDWEALRAKAAGGIRNATTTTIAPTGTISIIAGCSSGIEPVFALAFQHIAGERKLTFVDPVFESVASAGGFLTPEVREEVLKRGTARGVKGIPEDMQRVFATAHEVAPEWHIRHQAAFQKHTDNGVSKTINLPNGASRDDIRSAYMLAYDLGCSA
jgi:ribonucleoside-diphosphate reductase alpha chain